MNYNAIIICTLASQDAETILKHAESAIRTNWNLHGLERIDSGYATVLTDNFDIDEVEREVKVFTIAVKVPQHMNHHTALGYLHYGERFIDGFAEYYNAII